MLEDVVDCAVDKNLTSETYFDDQEKNIVWAIRVMRPFGILLAISGWFFTFIPIIIQLSWIPLVGSLLGATIAVAAVIFSIIVGLVMSILVIAIAWLVYRPLISVILLALFSIGTYFIFFFNKDAAFDVDDETTSIQPKIESVTALA